MISDLMISRYTDGWFSTDVDFVHACVPCNGILGTNQSTVTDHSRVLASVGSDKVTSGYK